MGCHVDMRPLPARAPPKSRNWDTNELERIVDVVMQGSGNVRPARVPYQTDHHVSDSRQCLRRRSLVHLTGIFPQRHSAHVMPPIFDRPVAAPQPLESGCGNAEQMCGSAVAEGYRLQPPGMWEPALYELPDMINGLFRLTGRSFPEESRGATEMPENKPELQLALLMVDQATAARPGIQENRAEHVGSFWSKIHEGND